MHPLRIGGIAAAGLVVVAAFLPWTSVSVDLGGRHVAGVAGYGMLTLIGGIAIGVLIGLWSRGTLIAAAVVAGVVVLIAAADLAQALAVLIGFGVLGYVTPGIGLFLTVLAGAGALIVALLALLALPAQRADAARAAPAPWAPAAPGAAAQPSPAASSAMPEGWYADPFDQAQVRYWDGVAWTGRTR